MTPDLERFRRAMDEQSVIGMRRAGKTTFLRLSPPWRLPFLRLEEEQLLGLDAPTLGTLLDEYPKRYLTDPEGAPAAWFLDEIQVVPGWERLVRRLLDSGSADIFLSGSSAALLSREIATELRGRGWTVLMHPFSFEEALRHGSSDAAATGLRGCRDSEGRRGTPRRPERDGTALAGATAAGECGISLQRDEVPCSAEVAGDRHRSRLRARSCRPPGRLFPGAGRANIGHALETAVFVELERRGCEVTYVRTPGGYEVDFLARAPGGDAELIQVCADASDPVTAEREIRALLDAAPRGAVAHRRLLTLTRAGLPPEAPPGIEACPAYEWLPCGFGSGSPAEARTARLAINPAVTAAAGMLTADLQSGGMLVTHGWGPPARSMSRRRLADGAPDSTTDGLILPRIVKLFGPLS